MDVRRLRTGELLAGMSAIGLLAVMSADWFNDASAWEALTIGRVVLTLAAVLGLALVVLTATSRSVAVPSSVAAITVGYGAIALLYAFYRVVVNEPGSNGDVTVHTAAVIGMALVFAIIAGAWRSMGDERTRAAASLRQTEQVLAVRGAPRPAPPPRDPTRGSSKR